MPNPNRITERLFPSPSKYIQGPSAIQHAARYLSKLGRSPLLACDDYVYEIAGKSLIDALHKADFKVTRGVFGGEASREEIDRLSALGQEHSVDFVIALGGGKTIDSAKAVADALGLQVAILPTTASTDAPCSALSVLYRPSGEFDRYTFFEKNPTIVLVDTTVIANSPPRFLASGIGDAIADERRGAALCEQSELRRGLPTGIGGDRAEVRGDLVQAVVEANTLLSGLGFESGGLAAAHAIHNGFTAIEAVHSLMHGEKVAFGTICQLVLDGASITELDRYIDLLLSVDLPVTFAQLGIPGVSDEELHRVAALACAPGETIWNLECVITEDIVVGVMKGADAAGRDYIGRSGWKKV
ncbi:Glycerol dehydrogenase [Grifola frondosa]|uniref:Glycerol dehydrogenase n=1 Tax=Grifola frondosa TaxID=5627 RepID=A0A1C7LXC6_GRIFR|nr:Glycerol dehydrogenase [Grifola frondosa]